MHPLSTYEVHRQDQRDLLHRSTRLHVREHRTEHADDAPGRPPDPAPPRHVARPRPAPARWAPTT